MSKRTRVIAALTVFCGLALSGPPGPVALTWTGGQVRNRDFGSRFTILGKGNEPIAILDNSTRQVLRAVLSDDLVLVLGSAGYGGLITIFNAPTKSECLELLCYDPHLSPDAEYVAFRRFYPPATDDSLVRDTLSVLSISAVRQHKIPCVTKAGIVPPMDLGADIYPSRPEKDQRIFGNLIWAADSRSFFFVDMGPSTGYVIGRADHTEADARWTVRTSSIQAVPGLPTGAASIGRFSTDGAGHLVVEAERLLAGGATKYQIVYDPETLEPVPEQAPGASTDAIPLEIPWVVAIHSSDQPSRRAAGEGGLDRPTG